MAEIYRYKVSWKATETNYYHGYVEMTEQQYEDATANELIEACIDNGSDYCADSESESPIFVDGACIDVVGDDGEDDDDDDDDYDDDDDDEEEDLSEEFP